MSKATTASQSGCINPDLYYTITEAAKIQGITVKRFKEFLAENDCKVCFICRGKFVIPGWCLAEVFEMGLVQFSELDGEGDK